jgi:hypothetical protein
MSPQVCRSFAGIRVEIAPARTVAEIPMAPPTAPVAMKSTVVETTAAEAAAAAPGRSRGGSKRGRSHGGRCDEGETDLAEHDDLLWLGTSFLLHPAHLWRLAANAFSQVAVTNPIAPSGVSRASITSHAVHSGVPGFARPRCEPALDDAAQVKQRDEHREPETSRQIDCEAFEIGQGTAAQGTFVSGAQDHPWCVAGLESFLPTRRT